MKYSSSCLLVLSTARDGRRSFPISAQVYNYPDSSIIAFIAETLHLGLPKRVRIYRDGNILYVDEPPSR